MKTFSMLLLSSLFTMGLMAVAQAQKPPTVSATTLNISNPEQYQAGDLRSKLRTTRLKAGENLVEKSSKTGLSLYAIAGKDRRITNWIIKDSRGRIIKSELIRQTTTNETTCWKCGKDASGDIHCWIIDCPVIQMSGAGN
ncbi:MAG TPA: hypothetical protein PKD70_00735 [Saprospiraceae bacterium]|nr:hypothetical protein [Saprospiraceae bacterium]HMP12371.1 hypothetical protein [Saprospiraceae bacterium]